MTERSGCAKVILCGEHAVVYGRPAIALPLPGLRAYARLEPRAGGEGAGELEIVAPDIGECLLPSGQPDHPLARIVQLTCERLHAHGIAAGLELLRGLRLTVESGIPVASHLGSGAAVSVACARAVAAQLGHELAPSDASALAFEVEKLHHGTPSGIDNTVIAYEQAVYFVKGQPVQMLAMAEGALSLPLVVADTGMSTPTKIPVGEVRRAWQQQRDSIEALFDAIGAQVLAARAALQAGNWPALGRAMDANQAILQALGVSCPELDGLCDAARAAGALGAKLSGGGRGGNMIALARDAGRALTLGQALMKAGAVRAFCA